MRRLLSTVVLVARAACGSTEPGDDFRGTYQIQTVNGKPLPASFQTAPGNSYTVSAASITALPDRQWFSSVKSTTVVNGQSFAGRAGLGTWVQSGNAVTFVDTFDPLNPQFFDGTLSGTTLTIVGDYTFVYTR